MLGAVIGDIVGSRFEWHNIKSKEFTFFLNDDGTFSHAHINPIDLELYHPKRDGIDDSPMDKLLLCASDLYRGEGSLDELYYFTMEYRKSKEKC